ncbi:MAG: ABC transporter permease [Gammaproteobacteria bacterium]
MRGPTHTYFIAYQTIVAKEIGRFMRIWIQTILPPAITMTLYFVIFGNLIGPRIGQMGGFDYIQYMAPGLIMMSVITHSYANVVSSFFGSKFQKHIEEMLVAPIPNSVIVAGYITGGVTRGLIVGVVVTVVALFFIKLTLHSLTITAATVLLTATLFSLGGLVNGIFAKHFDDTSVIPTFVLTPLTYLGGIFYSIDLLPEFWQKASLANPILYMVNAFRFGILGVSDINIGIAFGVIVLFILALTWLSLALMEKGVGIKT